MTLSRLRQARYAILGFGCNQAFLFAMLYLGSYNESSQHGFLIDRADLLCVLLVMAATFAFMTCERPRRHLMAAAEGLARCYALPLVGALYLIVALHSLVPGIPWLALARRGGLAAGVRSALLLCRWGRVLGETSIDQSVPEVFIGSAPWGGGVLLRRRHSRGGRLYPTVRAARGKCLGPACARRA